MIQFEWIWLFLILPLPGLFRLLLKPAHVVEAASLHTPFIHEYASIAVTHTQTSRTWIHWGLALLSWALLVTAVSRPQWVGEPIDLPFVGRDIMLAVDLSHSMNQRDFALDRNLVNRLTAIKAVAGPFIARRQGDRIGLILFADRAYLQTPLTFDRKTVSTLLYESFIGLAGKNTAIGDAIGLAVKRLQQQANKQPILILLTDGTNTAGIVKPEKAADLAAAKGIKIYTIGVQRQRGDLDEITLKNIAQKTGGRYFRATDTQRLNDIYQLLDALEPIEHEGQQYRPTQALFIWPLGLSVLLALGLMAYRIQRPN